MLNVIYGGAILLVLFFSPTPHTIAPSIPKTLQAVATTTTPVVVATTTPKILEKIAKCESGGRQFNEDGTLVRGVVNNQDIGKYQINAFYHEESAKKLGFDIYTEQGNTGYALHLFNTEGTKPWFWSEPCWNK